MPSETEVALLAAIVESSDDAIVSKTLDGVVTSWNRAAERIFGYRRAEMVGRPITVVFPPDRLGEEALFLERLARGERIDHYETVRVHKNGSLLNISVSLSPLHDASGRVIGASKIARDITDQKRAEALLHAQFESWRVTLSSIGDAVIAVDVQGLVTFVNSVAEELTGWPDREAQGRPLTEVFNIVNEQTRRGVDNPVARVLRDGVSVGLANSTVLIRRDGTEAPIDDRAAPIRDRDGAVIGVVLVFRDITERRRVETDRTRLLAAEQAGRAEAEVANRAKDEFLAMLAHELRNPLAAIHTGLAVLNSVANQDPVARGTRDVMSRQLRHLSRMVDDLLDVSRVSTGKITLNREAVDVPELIARCVATVTTKAGAEEHEISVPVRLPSMRTRYGWTKWCRIS